MNKRAQETFERPLRGKTGAARMHRKNLHYAYKWMDLFSNRIIPDQLPKLALRQLDIVPDKGEQIWKQGQQGLCAGVSVDRHSSRSVARNETPGFGFLQVSGPACSLHHAQNGVHTKTNLNRNKSISCPLWSKVISACCGYHI